MGKILQVLGFWIMAVLASPNTAAGQAKANAALDPARVSVGDTFALRVLVSGTRVTPRRVSFAAWQHTIPADNILARSTWQRSGEQWVQRVSLIALDTADLLLPPLTVYLHLGDTVQTNPVQLTVVGTTASSDLRDLDDVRDIRREPTQWYDYWPWAAAGLIALLVLYRLFRRRPKQQQQVQQAVSPAPPARSAREIALQKLEILEREKPWLSGNLLEYYAALSMIVREYVEHQYGIPAMESTTFEIGELLENTTFPQEHRPALDVLLQQSDLVKFAEMVPKSDYHMQALNKAKQLVG